MGHYAHAGEGFRGLMERSNPLGTWFVTLAVA